MKKINLDEINFLRGREEYYKEIIKDAEEAKARKKSEKSLEKAERDLKILNEGKADIGKRLAVLEAEAEEAKKFAAEGGEVVVAHVWLDDYGREDSEVNRSLWNSVEEAEDYYHRIKDGNGGYIKAWIEVRNVGEFDRLRKIKAEIERLEAELKEIEG